MLSTIFKILVQKNNYEKIMDLSIIFHEFIEIISYFCTL